MVFEEQKVFRQKEVRLARRDIAPDRRRKGFQKMKGSLFGPCTRCKEHIHEARKAGGGNSTRGAFNAPSRVYVQLLKISEQERNVIR